MKNHSLIIDLLIFLLFLCAVILPVYNSLTQNYQNFTDWTFPFSQLISFCTALFILIFYKENESTQKNKLEILLNKVFPGIFSLCLLFLTALTLKSLTFVVKNEFWTGKQEVILPDSPSKYSFCILSFLFAAFYEEVVYRFYLPEIFKCFVLKKINKKINLVLSESLALILFSAAHIYLGGFAVVNAVIAHCILRMCFIKSKSIIPGFSAHFVYNLMVLFLL